MKITNHIACLLFFSLPLLSFNDFDDYWTIKLNGKEIYNSSKDKKGPDYLRYFKYNVGKDKLLPTDSLEVEYFTDSPCVECIYSYFISEYSEKDDEVQQPLGTYLKEQKSIGPRSYKLSVMDILSCGTNGTIKAIYYYENCHPGARTLCRIRFI